MGRTERPRGAAGPTHEGTGCEQVPTSGPGSERSLCLELPTCPCWEQLTFLEIVSAWVYSRAHFQKHTFNQKGHQKSWEKS